MTMKPADRQLYSDKWLMRYGKTLHRDEIRLVQGYRGLPPAKRAALLALVSNVILVEAESHAHRRKGGR